MQLNTNLTPAVGWKLGWHFYDVAPHEAIKINTNSIGNLETKNSARILTTLWLFNFLFAYLPRISLLDYARSQQNNNQQQTGAAGGTPAMGEDE